MLTFWLCWLLVGVATGYLASRRPALSMMKCLTIGTLLGPLALVLFFLPIDGGAPLHVSCPYCANTVTASARLCHHCGAILVTE